MDGLVNVNIDSDVAERVAETLGLPGVDLAGIDRSGRTQFSTHPANLQLTRPRFADQAAVLAGNDGALWERPPPVTSPLSKKRAVRARR